MMQIYAIKEQKNLIERIEPCEKFLRTVVKIKSF